MFKYMALYSIIQYLGVLLLYWVRLCDPELAPEKSAKCCSLKGMAEIKLGSLHAALQLNRANLCTETRGRRLFHRGQRQRPGAEDKT